MTSHFNQTVACPSCHHTDHAISKDLHTYEFVLWPSTPPGPLLHALPLHTTRGAAGLAVDEVEASRLEGLR